MRPSPLVFAIVLVMLSAWTLAVAQQPTSNPSAQPATTTAGTQASADPTTDANDPLFGVPPLPKGNTSLLGGTVQKIDRIRNHVTVKPFGDSGKVSVFFDERTHIYRDGVEVTERGIQRGDRVYVDTMQDDSRLFARNIRVVTHLAPADARGQLMSYDAQDGMMTVRAELSSQAVSFRVTQDTAVKGAGGTRDLVPGSLVAVRFSPDQRDLGVAREVSVLAVPGSSFTFAGKVRHLDLRTGTLVVENQADNKTYELQFEPGVVGDNVMVGSDVSVSALFNGNGYQAKSVTVNVSAAQ